MGDRKFELCTEIKGERDKWFEAIKNSRKTGKDYKNSISHKPRNLNKILNFFEKEGMSKIFTICENEKNKLCQNFTDMYYFFYFRNSFEILEMLILNVKKLLHQVYKL